jgi:hypothetical protein
LVNETPEETIEYDMMDLRIEPLWVPIALLIAFLTCLAGYLSKTPPEQFKLANFLFTLLISVTIGTLTLMFG